MNVDLLELRTDDGLALPAGFFAPTGERKGSAIDAVLVMTGTFYQDLWTALATSLAGAGYPALTMSARTHAVVWRDLHTATNHGSAYQSLDEMMIDYHAAFRALRDRGYERIALYGHSIAGTRVLYYAAHNPDPALNAVISSAGPTFTDDLFLASPRAAEYREAKAVAEEAVAAGRGRELMTFDFPQKAGIFVPSAWLETYTSGRYDVCAWAQNIQVPVLRIECELESPTNKQMIDGVADELFKRLPPNPAHQYVVIPGADHYFTKEFPAACQTVNRWLDSLPG